MCGHCDALHEIFTFRVACFVLCGDASWCMTVKWADVAHSEASSDVPCVPMGIFPAAYHRNEKVEMASFAFVPNNFKVRSVLNVELVAQDGDCYTYNMQGMRVLCRVGLFRSSFPIINTLPSTISMIHAMIRELAYPTKKWPRVISLPPNRLAGAGAGGTPPSPTSADGSSGTGVHHRYR